MVDKDPAGYLRDKLYPRLFTVHVVPADGVVRNGSKRPRNWSLRYDGPDTPPEGPLSIQSRDLVRFVMPPLENSEPETGWVTFIQGDGADPEGSPIWPFGENPLRVVGSRVLPCSLPPLAILRDDGEPISALRYRYSIYLEGYDDLVDENSTPVVIIHDPT